MSKVSFIEKIANFARCLRRRPSMFHIIVDCTRYLFVQFNIFVEKNMGRKIVIVDLEELQFLPFLLPIVKDIQSRNLNVSFYGSTLRTYMGMMEFNSFNIPAEKWLTTNWVKRIRECDVFLSAHIHGHGPTDALKINVFHNQPVKYLRYPKQALLKYDAHFLMGPLQRRQMEQMIAYHAIPEDKIKLYNIGYPKIDDLTKGGFKRDEILKGMALDTRKKTVLYAPSWDEGLSLREFGVACVQKLIEIDGINVLVKLHPASCVPKDNPNFTFYTGGVEWAKIFDPFKNYQNYHFIEGQYLNSILAVTDIMITDVSSVALEFIVLNRPIIFFDCPIFFEHTLSSVYAAYGETMPDEARTNPMTNAGRNAGLIISDPDGLLASIQECIANPEGMSQERQDLAKQLLYNPGCGSEVAGRHICSLLKLPIDESFECGCRNQQE